MPFAIINGTNSRGSRRRYPRYKAHPGGFGEGGDAVVTVAS